MLIDNTSLLARASYSATLEKQLHENFYYQQSWFDLLANVYGYTVVPLSTTDQDGTITGFLPLCSISSPITGRRLVSLPFSDYCPLLAADEASANALANQAVDLARRQKAKYLELRTGCCDALARRADLVEEDLYVRWLISLPTDSEMLWSELRKPIQRQVKKSQKLGVQVREARDRQDVAHYYRLHLQTRSKKHGMPAQPQRYFYRLWDTFASSGSMRLLLAEHEGVVIADMILLASGTTIRYAYGASDERYLRLAPNDLLMWSAIQLGCDQGYRTFDLGRTARDNEGLMEFKRRWGATQEPLPYYYFPRVEGLASTSEQSLKYRVLTSCWKKLPLPVAGSLGGYLYRHMG